MKSSQPKSYYQNCSLAQALDLIGDRWSLLIIRDLMSGRRRFKELAQSLKGIGTNLLTKRLYFLRDKDIIEEASGLAVGSYGGWQLTAKGKKLEPILVQLAQWGIESPPDIPNEKELTWYPHWNHIALKARFKKDKANGLTAIYSYEIEGYQHYVVVKEGTTEVFEGLPAECDFHLKVSKDEFLSLLTTKKDKREDFLERPNVNFKGSRKSFLKSFEIFGY